MKRYCRAGTFAKSASSPFAIFTNGLNRFLEILATAIPTRKAEARRRKALAAMAEMIGAIVLARAIDDEALSAQLLDAVREDLIDRSAEG
ncbi:MAG TPA: hypothetical protein VGD08_21740 [Stellaceae bacterium]